MKRGAGKKWTPARARQAVELARQRAQEQKAPLTAERLAAVFGLTEGEYQRLVRGKVAEEESGLAAILRQADAQATAEVVEAALTRGSSVNMHLQYLRRHSGYGDPTEEGEVPLRIVGEEEI